MTLLPDSGFIPVRLRFMQVLIVCGSVTVPLELTKAAPLSTSSPASCVRARTMTVRPRPAC